MAQQIDWVSSKENIQPLRRGRNMTSLTEALQNPEYLEETRRRFEEDLRTYEGDDPLTVWDSYLIWIEDHYPCGLHGLHLTHLLENCISTFLNERRYDNDSRLVRVWLKFASLQTHPEEVFKTMLARNIGIGSSFFYTEWADFHELSGEPKRAQEILEKGITARAEPQAHLKSSLKQLILRLSQGSTKPQKESSDESEEGQEARILFSRLRATEKSTAPVIRTGTNRLAPKPGTVQSSSVPATKNRKVSVFVDDRNPERVLDDPPRTSSSLGSSSKAFASTSEKENSVISQKLVKQKFRQLIEQKKTPSFLINLDDDDGNVKASLGAVNSVLLSRKEMNTQMTLSSMLDGPNINEKRMYDFLKVYAGVSEFQFEEIRFAKMKRISAESNDKSAE